MYKCRSILGVKISNREVDLDLCNFFKSFYYRRLSQSLSLFNSCENLHGDFRAMLNKGESPFTVSASVFPVFLIALINIARICLERIKNEINHNTKLIEKKSF